MAAKPKWLLRIPEIIRYLQELPAPVVDRAVIEQLFELRRRRAIQLMHAFGGYQAGRTFLLDRAALIAGLERLQSGEDFAIETQRRERLNIGLDRLRRHYVGNQVRIPVQPEVFSTCIHTLDPDVQIASGQLLIEFTSTEDLLTKLFELAQAAANDFDAFQSLTNDVKAPG